jgi:REP element-mobilizing transposase RayT
VSRLLNRAGRAGLRLILNGGSPLSRVSREQSQKSVRSKNLFLEILDEVRDRYGFLLAGYVLMPEHIHLLISEPATGTPTVMQVLKQRVSRRLRRKPRATSSSPLF